MVTRLAKKRLVRLLKDNPAVCLMGPRQCGKTTLAKGFAGDYFDLEQEADRLKLELMWEELVAGRRLVILDEAQSYPPVFPKLRGAIDHQRKRHGRFLLLGSISPALMKEVSESLAGRLALLELTPLILPEVGQKEDSLWFFGGFPDGGILQPRKYPRWANDYLGLLAQRDLPLWGLPATPQVTSRLFKMVAASHGQIWNASQIGSSLGLNYHTIDGYMNYLENTFLTRRLPSYATNLKKRIVKSPKVYWRDSGLLHALMNLSGPEQLLNQPWVGASFEGWVIEQITTFAKMMDFSCQDYFWRTSNGDEIDLLLETPRHRWALEIKLSASPSLGDFTKLRKNAALVNADQVFMIARVKSPLTQVNEGIVNLASFLKILEEKES